MYQVDLIGVSNGTTRNGEPFTIYRILYRNKAGQGLFTSLYSNSPVIVSGQMVSMEEAFELIGDQKPKFDIYNGPENTVVLSFALN